MDTVSDKVHMSHEGVEALGETTRKAFETFWKHKGWKEVPATTAQAGEILGKPVTSLDKLSEDELKAVAAQSGVVVDDKAKKADLVKAVEGPETGEVA